MNKKLVLILILLIFIIATVTAAPYLIYKDCVVIDVGENDIVAPVYIDLDKAPKGFEFFKPEFRPEPKPYYKPELNLSILSGLPLDTWSCE